MNAYSGPLTFQIPASPSGRPWRRAVDTALPSPDDALGLDEGPQVAVRTGVSRRGAVDDHPRLGGVISTVISATSSAVSSATPDAAAARKSGIATTTTTGIHGAIPTRKRTRPSPNWRSESTDPPNVRAIRVEKVGAGRLVVVDLVAEIVTVVRLVRFASSADAALESLDLLADAAQLVLDLEDLLQLARRVGQQLDQPLLLDLLVRQPGLEVEILLAHVLRRRPWR